MAAAGAGEEERQEKQETLQRLQWAAMCDSEVWTSDCPSLVNGPLLSYQNCRPGVSWPRSAPRSVTTWTGVNLSESVNLSEPLLPL